MIRPCVLVIDREYSGTISTRKLVIETAKLNVITAYSGVEAIETFQRFPNVDAVILNASLHDVPCAKIIDTIQNHSPNLPILVVQGPGAVDCPGAHTYLDSFDPVQLLEVLRKLFPQAAADIREQEEALKAQETGNSQ